MEALAAIGLAAAIVQFVDFGSKLISIGYASYKAVSGAGKEYLRLEEVTSDLETLSENLGKSVNVGGRLASKDERAMQNLAQECQALASNLVATLESLKVSGKGLHRSWDALRKAVRSAMQAKDLVAAEKELEKIKSQLALHLLSLMKNEQSAMYASIRELHEKSKLMQLDSLKAVEAARKALIDATKQLNTSEQRNLRTTLTPMSDAETNARSRLEESLNAVAERLKKLSHEILYVEKAQKILESLRFREMYSRHSDIHDTYAGTYEWIFNDDQTAFKTWLKDESGVFWISGKAGSGKSTLMKFMVDHPQTGSILEQWAGSQDLVTASYYFWNAGHPMQKNQQGLLQSLLFQILRQSPDLIPEAAVERWNADDLPLKMPDPHLSLSDPWTRKEISHALQRVVAKAKLTAKFCFFIDGLDEYAGDHYDLVKDLASLCGSSAVKLCISSRPWNVFTTAYGQDHQRMLVLQDLTRADMHMYVKGMLEDDSRYLRLSATDSRAQDLVNEIRDRAQGVFLWVFLVIRSLLKGLTEQDDIPELQRRLRSLPRDLEEYFLHMMNTIEDVYQPQMARSLLLASHALVPLPVLIFLYLEEEMANPEFAVSMAGCKTIMLNDNSKAREKVSTRLNKWCRDFVEIKRNPLLHPLWEQTPLEDWWSVDFLHRTVKDFLLMEDMQEILFQRAGDDFKPYLTLCRLFLAATKISAGGDSTPIFPDPNAIAHTVMLYASKCEQQYGMAPAPLLRELHATVPSMGNTIVGAESYRWDAKDPRMLASPERIGSYADFLGLACDATLIAFIQLELQRISVENRPRTCSYILALALCQPLRHNTPFNPNFLDPDYLASLYDLIYFLLLQMGADLNADYKLGPGWKSPWRLFMNFASSTFQYGEQQVCQFGADDAISTPERSHFERGHVLAVIRLCVRFGANVSEQDLEALRRRFTLTDFPDLDLYDLPTGRNAMSRLKTLASSVGLRARWW